jgi:hypothetical protein
VTGRCDSQGEMPNPEFLEDDEVIEAILSGRRPVPAACPNAVGAEFDSLVAFSRDVRTVADRSVPRPSASLAAVLSAGFSTEKGDLLVTAGSNVPGPAKTQVAGLPKWRKTNSMLPTTGLLSGLVAKIVAGVTAGLAGLTAAGAAGALPGPAQDAVANVVNLVSPFTLPGGDSSTSISADIGTNPAGPGVNVGVGTSGSAGTAAATNSTAGASTAGGGAQASASTSAGTGTPAGGGTNANLGAETSTPLPSIPGVPNLQNLPIPVPQCVKDIVDLKTGQPKVPLDQIATQVTACVRSLMNLSTAQLPVNTNQCISAVLSMVTSIRANPGSVPNLTGFDFSKCVPVDSSRCMSSMMNLTQNLPFGSFGFGLGGTAGTGGASAGASASGIPGLSGLNLDGCIPFDLEACLSSLLSMAGNLPGVPTGGIPGLGSGSLPSVGNVDLSACVPLGALGGTIPGLGSLSGFLPR